MVKLPIPAIRVRTLLNACTHELSKGDLKARLESVAGALEQEEGLYAQRGAAAQLYSYTGDASVGSVTRDEMVWVYDVRLSKGGSAGRQIYNSLRASVAKCPLCNLREVSTLDHYLAKAVHAFFVLTPMNLVPACKDCNTVKSSRSANGPLDQLLHPYFDDVDTDAWLVADVQPSSPPTVRFSARPPGHWDQVKQGRLRTHFTVFGLGALYASNAANEISGIAYHLKKLADGNGGPEDVRQHLANVAESWRHHGTNSWQAALYEALATSDWFWQGGHHDTVA